MQAGGIRPGRGAFVKPPYTGVANRGGFLDKSPMTTQMGSRGNSSKYG